MKQKLFYVALAFAGKSMNEFAEELGVTRQTVHNALHGRSNSPITEEAIAKFTADQLTLLYRFMLDNNILDD